MSHVNLTMQTVIKIETFAKSPLLPNFCVRLRFYRLAPRKLVLLDELRGAL